MLLASDVLLCDNVIVGFADNFCKLASYTSRPSVANQAAIGDVDDVQAATTPAELAASVSGTVMAAAEKNSSNTSGGEQ